jgi:hypothetical protein
MTLSNRLTARVGLIAAIIVGCGMFLVAPASARTSLLGSDPAENAQVVSLSQVSLRFSESAPDGHVATGAIDEAAAQAPGTSAATAGQPAKNGSSHWVMVFSGLFIGIGIGGAMVFMRNRRPR